MGKQLVTIDEYKDHASINSIDFDDRIQSIINRISEFIKSYCGRNFIDNFDKATNTFTDIEEYSNIPGYFYTREFPIQEVTNVEYSSNKGTSYISTIFYYDKSKDAVYIDNNNEGINAYKITYKGGYAKTPEDLKLACMDLIDYYYKSESVPRKSSNNNTIEYIMSSDLPSHIKRVLDIYRVIL